MEPTGSEMRKVQVRLPEELVEALTAEAVAQDRTLSYVVRKALEVHVGGAVSAAGGGRAERSQRPVIPSCPPHDWQGKRATSFGFAQDCSRCGKSKPL